MKLSNYHTQSAKTSDKSVDDFNCRCVQQELDLSELTRIDAASYKSIKQALITNASKVNKIIALSKPQMDFFI